LRWLILRACGVDARAWNIGPRCVFGTTDVAIGRGTFINRGCVFDAMAPIRIGGRCAIGMEVMVITSTHAVAGPDRRAGELEARPVTIGKGCWIGSRVVILPGVTVGDGVIIASGAVVSRDCDANMLYAGIPARPIRAL
jgi:maltose O-acetyltransferase